MQLPLLVTIALLAGGTTALDTQDDTATHTVIVSDFAFRDEATGSPVTVAQVGDEIAFVLASGIHTATAGIAGTGVGPGPDSPIMQDEGDVYTYKVTEPGTYPYTCLIHAEMDGLIIVLP